MSYNRNMFNNVVTLSEGRAEGCIDIEAVMDRYGVNLSAARVLKVIDRLVCASRLRGVKDKRGVAYCYASKEWIAGQIGKSVRTVARAIHELKAAGVIECQRTRTNARIFICGYEVYKGVDHGMKDEAESHGVAESDAKTEAECAASVEIASEEREEKTVCAAGNDRPCATDGISGSDKNGTSNIIPKSNNNQAISICLSARGKGQGDDGLDRFATGKPQSKRAATPEEQRQYKARMRDQLLPFADYDGDNWRLLDVIAEIAAETVANKRGVKVNGGTVDSETFWRTVSNIDARAELNRVIDEFVVRDSKGLIRNKRAYLMACLYNCSVWGSSIRDVSPGIEAYHRLACRG